MKNSEFIIEKKKNFGNYLLVIAKNHNVFQKEMESWVNENIVSMSPEMFTSKWLMMLSTYQSNLELAVDKIREMSGLDIKLQKEEREKIKQYCICFLKWLNNA